MAEANDSLLDSHLKMVGTLVTNAALCDLVLFNAFKIISGCDGKVANAIYFAFESFQSKKTIISRVLKANRNQHESTIVNQIVDATEKAQKQRNELSHALLQVKGDQLLRLNARQQGQPGKPITALYLDGLLEQSSRASIAAHKAYQVLCQKRGISQPISHE